MDLEPGQKIGQYTVVKRLGQGGMSRVYLADDTPNDRQVVLKFPNQDMMGDVATHERFTREVKIGQLLNHPHIQQLYELGYERNLEYIVLEYVPGGPMRFMLRDKKHHDPDDFAHAIDLGLQIGSALEYAHTHHVAHRDLKPENVIVTPDNQAKVMDFGIALLKGARRVTWGPLSNQVGTPDYMSPEQIQGGRGDARTDIYALGMILYEFIAGKLPYNGDNALAVMNQHVNVKAQPIHNFRKDVPLALEEVIMKAIRLNPQDRWQKMSDMVAALRELDKVDVDALRTEREAEPDGGRAGKAASRLPLHVNRGTLLVAVVLCAIIIGLIVVAGLVGHHHSPLH
jgi:serine/threonine-protein kinase